VPCHEKEVQAYAASVHGAAAAAGNLGAARCIDCHGAHDIRKRTDPESRVYRRKLPYTCGQCHKNPAVAAKLGIRNKYAGGRYLESIHGRALLVEGLVVAPSCVDCHGTAHDIRPANDSRSTVNRKQVVHTCGRCHEGVAEAYAASVHARAASSRDRNGPICIDCHTAHQVVESDATFALASDRICGRCHADRFRRYQLTYHGRAHSLGDKNVAACFDCHGAHTILPSSDPKSTLSAANRVTTCRQCHPRANQKFAAFLAHADPGDREHYPGLFYAFVAMTALLLGTFGFFGVHTLLWFGRGLREYFRDPTAFKEAKRLARAGSSGRAFARFEPVDRLCHLLLILSFLLLVSTGMPLKFHEAAWARSIFDMLGGAGAAAGLHRIGAFLTGVYMSIHVTRMVNLLWRAREKCRDADGKVSATCMLRLAFGPDSPLPNLQDVRDFYAHVRWFVGRGPRPQFDRFTYWEKFDYMAVFWGVTVIGLSGLIMWFPGTVTRVLPGWVINVAHIIHSDEALLAAGFIFTVHFFNSHFRPDKFPMDTVIFSGAISEEELRHERPRMYARLKASGELEKLAVVTDWKSWKPIMAPLGAIFLIVGLCLAVGIFWALARSLLASG
jgi:cytochrome b subunit of formate dehydrogenase